MKAHVMINLPNGVEVEGDVDCDLRVDTPTVSLEFNTSELIDLIGEDVDPRSWTSAMILITNPDASSERPE